MSTSSKDADGTEDHTLEAVDSEKDGDEASEKKDGAFLLFFFLERKDNFIVDRVIQTE